MRHYIKNSFILFLLALIGGCKSETVPDADKSSICTGASGCNSAENGDGSGKSGLSDVDKRNHFNNNVPNYNDASLSAFFNRNKDRDPEIPAEYKTVFLGKRVDAYRPVFFDIAKYPWYTSTLGELAKGTEEAPGQLTNVTIFQPLVLPSLLPFYPDALIYFLTVGHTANPALATPRFPTLMLIPSPWGPTDAGAPINWPSDYRLVYHHSEGPTTRQLIQNCQTAQDAAHHIIGQWKTNFECQTLLGPGFGAGFSIITSNAQVAALKSPNELPGGTGVSFDIFFNMLSVAFWRPVPPQGYQCLGDVATNDGVRKPATETDNINDPTINIANLNSAVYCVAEKYLLPGYLDKAIMSDGTVTLYTIGSKEPDAYLDSNLFMASTQAKGQTKAWVLNKKFLKMLPDDLIQSK